MIIYSIFSIIRFNVSGTHSGMRPRFRLQSSGVCVFDSCRFLKARMVLFIDSISGVWHFVEIR